MIQIEDLRTILNSFASVWPNSRFQENLTVRFYFLKISEYFRSQDTHIYRPFGGCSKTILKKCVFSKYFLKLFHW